MNQQSTPRVNSNQLGNHIGGIVRLVGTIRSKTDSQAILETADKGQISILLQQGSECKPGVVEILGKVENVGTVREMAVSNFNPDFGNNGIDPDAEIYSEMVQVSEKYKEVF
ncbi:60S acidic ribosomal protein P1-alpha 3 [Boothiomyces macroporosus]|uniref:60S acidic ribosomal protein P1-alpha 3 n=1 Tax=Boothiomyces macroporosus TaxID=261099 RepID=A0AAD5UHR2_9FUNG|nr:60S acidic ribosomal protein P1-alpha 3 [Boothiomyces macroporosus]